MALTKSLAALSMTSNWYWSMIDWKSKLQRFVSEWKLSIFSERKTSAWWFMFLSQVLESCSRVMFLNHVVWSTHNVNKWMSTGPPVFQSYFSNRMDVRKIDRNVSNNSNIQTLAFWLIESLLWNNQLKKVCYISHCNFCWFFVSMINGYSDDKMAKNYHCRERKLCVNLSRERFLWVRKLGFDFLVTFISLLCFSMTFV